MEFKNAPSSSFQPVPAQDLWEHQYTYPDFRMFNNLTEFEAKLADKLSYIKTMTYYDRYQVLQYHRELRNLQIATLVLSSITVISIIAFIVHRLYTFYFKHKSQQQIIL